MVLEFRLENFKFIGLITGGQHHTLVLTNDNECFAIGRKDYGRLGLGDVAEEVVDKLTSIKKLENLNIIQLECGECCSFALTDDGKAYSWGMGSNQQLGCGSDEDQNEPVLLTGVQVKDRQIIRISSGGQHTLFVAAEKCTITNGGVNGVHTNGDHINDEVTSTTN